MSGRFGRVRRGVLLAAGLGAAFALVGCGIRPTEGPINAGAPASRLQSPTTGVPPSAAQHQVYFIRDGRPQAVPRGGAVQLPTPGTTTRVPTTGDPERLSLIFRLLRELAEGPSPEEAAAGWTTALPKGGVRDAIPVPGDPLDLVRLDVDVLGALSPPALGQIVCTLEHAARTPISLAGRTGPGTPLTCASFTNGTVPVPVPSAPGLPGSKPPVTPTR